LRHIVTVRTDRTVHRVTNTAGEVVVEIADDRVDDVAAGQRAATLSSWREIEAELGPAGTDETLTAVAEQLTRSGAAASTSPNKVAKALGVTPGTTDRATGPTARKTAGDLIRGYLTEQDDALIAGDLSLRRGLGGIHPT